MRVIEGEGHGEVRGRITTTIEKLEALETEAAKKASLPILAQLKRIQKLLKELGRDELSTTKRVSPTE